MSPGLLSLVQWLSPAFPTGAFAYSHGMEWAIVQGELPDRAALQRWLEATLRFGAGWQDAVLLAQALQPGADHAGLDAIARALAPSAERLAETLEQGTAFALGVAAVTGRELVPRCLPVALGEAAAPLHLAVEQVVALSLHAFAANLVSVAVRFVPLGQSDGQAVLAALHPLIGELALAAAGATIDDIRTSALRSDLGAMQHETMDVRIYRT